MGYLQKQLIKDERIVLTTRRHWIVLLPTILVDASVAIVITALSVSGFLLSPPYTLFGLLLLLVPLGHFLYRFTVWRSQQHVVTNRRVIELRGSFNKYVSDTSLDKINDVVMTQSALGRLLGYGDIRVISGSDVGVDTFRRVAKPIRFKMAMLQQTPQPVEGPDEGASAAAAQAPELLEQLNDLRRRGVITEEEFAQERKELLERLQ